MKRNIDEPSRLLLDPQSEKDLLNALISQAGHPFETHELSVELFANPPLAQIFISIKAVHELGVEVNSITVANMLSQRGQLDGVGGHAYISTLGGYCPSVEPFYTNLHEAMRRRKLLKLAQMMEGDVGSAADVDAFVATVNTELASLDPASNGDHVLLEMADRVLLRLQRAREGNLVRGTPTFFPWWEHFFGGLVEGGYYGIGARPGMGKSAMMEQMMMELAKRQIPFCCFAQDMAPDILLERMACREVGVSKWALDHGRLSHEQLDEIQTIIEGLVASPFRLHCVERLTGEQMVQIARRDMRKFGVKHFFLDHVQTIHVPARQERNEAWADASQMVRKFVNNNPVSWVSLAHLNREAAKEAARAHQIRGFDDLLGDVDGLVLLDSNINPADLQAGQDWDMAMVVDKNRNGPCGSKKLSFKRDTMAFTAVTV